MLVFPPNPLVGQTFQRWTWDGQKWTMIGGEQNAFPTGPTPPAGMEANWIYTAPDEPWFVLFRIYGPQKAALDRSWMMGDIELFSPASH